MLLDNGSLRPGGVLFLRRVAERLSVAAGVPVAPVSLDYSDRIDSSALGGMPGLTLATHLAGLAASGIGRVAIVPFFISGGGGIMKLVERCLAIASGGPCPEVCRTGFLLEVPGAGGDAVARAVLRKAEASRDGLGPAALLLVDHGSPFPAAGLARNFLAGQVAALADRAAFPWIGVSSMERREGEAYDFNEPLFASALPAARKTGLPVVVGQLFLGEGRHAGPGGDIAGIVAEVCAADRNGPPVHLAAPLGDAPEIITALAARMQGPLVSATPGFCRLADRSRCPCTNRAGG